MSCILPALLFALLVVPLPAQDKPPAIQPEFWSPPAPQTQPEAESAEAPAEPAAPEPQSQARIGFVDIELIIENSRAIGDALDRIDREMADQAKEIEDMRRELKRQQYELDRQERVLSLEERDKRRGEINLLMDGITRSEFDFEQELKGRERQVAPVLEKIMQIVADVAARDGYDLVLRGEVVIYGSKSVDLTPEVVRELDRRAPEIGDLFGGVRGGDEDTSPTQRRDGRISGQDQNVLPLIP
ncbi:OmpH family outer membrane protein [Candidatus Poribacteria bacterium]|nr:OmpH family outer membrane protein [Candidatus Poribacteria bacterium]